MITTIAPPIDDNLWRQLLAPISAAQPTGTDSREDISPSALYQQIRSARTKARNNERAKLSAGEIDYFSYAEWSIVLNHAPTILTQQSKDLEVIAWYIEALTRHHGFLGLSVGFQLATETIETFDQAVYPRSEEDGISSQLSALSGLNGFSAEGALIAPIKSIPITEGDTPGPLATWQCQQAFDVDRIKDEARRNTRIKQGALSRDILEQVVSQTPREFFRQTLNDLEAAITSFSRYQSVIDKFAARDPQPTAAIEQTLAGCKQTLVYLAGEDLNSAQPAELESPAAGEPSTHTGQIKPHIDGNKLNSRAQAIGQLRQIAQFFRLTEPHSPISYSLEQAIRWSDLALTELIGELIPDEPARKKFKHLTGIAEDNLNNH